MKALMLILGLAMLGTLGATQIPSIATMLRIQGTSMTYQELFTKTLEALEEVSGLEWTPATDYKYSASFTKAERLTLSELNDILPPIFQKHGLQFTGFQTGDRSSGGGVTAPGLRDYYMDIEYSQYALSLNLRGRQFYVGIVENPNNAVDLEQFAYKTLGDASRDIAARLVGSSAAIKNRVECTPSSDDAYCVTTKATRAALLKSIIEGFLLSGYEDEITRGFKAGGFDLKNLKAPIIDIPLGVRVAYQRKGTSDEYTVWDADYKRKNFTITYSANSTGQSIVRVQANWINGYTPPPEK